MAARPRSPEKAFAWYDPRTASQRLLLSAVVGVGTGLLLPGDLSWILRALAGWNAASVVMLAVSGFIIVRSDADETKRRAAAEDPGRPVLSSIVLLSSVVALAAATVIARKAHQTQSDESAALVALSLLAVVSAWFLTHAVYTLRYARLFYQRDDDGQGGLEFPGDEPPDDLDFAYFAFTLGMTFQTSDVEITSRTIRRTALKHSLTAFAFNTLIVANVLNVLAELFKS
jgi:uncharacterized membrane protein